MPIYFLLFSPRFTILPSTYFFNFSLSYYFYRIEFSLSVNKRDIIIIIIVFIWCWRGMHPKEGHEYQNDASSSSACFDAN